MAQPRGDRYASSDWDEVPSGDELHSHPGGPQHGWGGSQNQSAAYEHGTFLGQRWFGHSDVAGQYRNPVYRDQDATYDEYGAPERGGYFNSRGYSEDDRRESADGMGSPLDKK